MYCVYGNSSWYIHGGPLYGGGPLLGGSFSQRFHCIHKRERESIEMRIPSLYVKHSTSSLTHISLCTSLVFYGGGVGR